MRICDICYCSYNSRETCPVCAERAAMANKKFKTRRNRHNRQRIISKRLRIIKHIWQVDYSNEPWFKPGRFSKYNLSCNCWMCSHPPKPIEDISDELSRIKVLADCEY